MKLSNPIPFPLGGGRQGILFRLDGTLALIFYLREHAALINKAVPNVKGARIWLVTGEGNPRKYYLCD
jgi:hypothetical protein